MRVLIACEESQIVCMAFRNVGIEAYSCDLLPCSGGHPEWHIQDDVLKHLDDDFDMMIAHPPCTYLSYAANRHWNSPGRDILRQVAMELFMKLYNAPIEKICIENPVGYPNTVFRKPDQIIHPYYFGDPELKRTCLWLKGLPKLDYSQTIIEKPKPYYYSNGEKTKGQAIYFTEAQKQGGKQKSIIRSRTFPGIAKAMAEQWGCDKRINPWNSIEH